MSNAGTVLQQLWRATGADPSALDHVTLTGADPMLRTDFKIGTAASAVIAATALAATEVWRLRTGRAQTVSVDLRAAIAAFKSERFLRVDGDLPSDRPSVLFGFYRAADGRWIQLHTNMPHHREGILGFLNAEPTREAIGAAVEKWKAQDLEDALAAAGCPSGMVRSRDEWLSGEQGKAIATLPLFEIIKIGDSRPEPLGAGPRPLSGVRVLDLTRVIAGPVCGRVLASYGADVLRATSSHLPDLPGLVIDTGLGKLSALLDLRRGEDAEQLRRLIRDADVFSQSYRPGALAKLGFTPEEAARLRPGIIYVTLSAYSHTGPWRERRGFETLIQSVSGMAHEQGRLVGADGPRHLPAQVVDHGTGHLGALGALIALARRAREGGSYLVRVSLAQTGRWVDSLGRVDGRDSRDLRLEDVGELLAECESPFGRLRYVVPAARLSETPAFWARTATAPGTHEPAWPK